MWWRLCFKSLWSVCGCTIYSFLLFVSNYLIRHALLLKHFFHLPFIPYLMLMLVILFSIYLPVVCSYDPSDNIKQVNQTQHSVSSEKNQAALLASDGRLVFVAWLTLSLSHGFTVVDSYSYSKVSFPNTWELLCNHLLLVLVCDWFDLIFGGLILSFGLATVF